MSNARKLISNWKPIMTGNAERITVPVVAIWPVRIDSAQAVAPKMVPKAVKTTPKKIHDVWLAKCMLGSALSGSLGFNAHYANIVAAFYLAIRAFIRSTRGDRRVCFTRVSSWNRCPQHHNHPACISVCSNVGYPPGGPPPQGPPRAGPDMNSMVCAPVRAC